MTCPSGPTASRATRTQARSTVFTRHANNPVRGQAIPHAGRPVGGCGPQRLELSSRGKRKTPLPHCHLFRGESKPFAIRWPTGHPGLLPENIGAAASANQDNQTCVRMMSQRILNTVTMVGAIQTTERQILPRSFSPTRDKGRQLGHGA